MDIKPWSEVKISEPEAVLFIYLMFRKDYPYHIAKEFRNAIGGKFSWDNVPGSDSNELLRCLKEYFDIEWTKYVEIIRKINDGKAIQIRRGGNSAEIKIDEIKEKATLKINDGKTYNLKVKKENGKLIIIFKEKKWDDRVKLGGLKHENKVAGLLKQMARKNLLLELPGPGVGRPKNDSIKADMVNNPRRKYYRVNPNVLGMSHLVVLTEKEIKEIREYIRQDEHFGFDPEELLPEQYADFAIFFVYGTSSIESEMGAFFLSSKTVRSALHTLELCAPDVLSCIQFINTLKKYDYLTILMTARAMFKKIQDYISPDSYALTFDCLKEIIPTDGSEEELKVWIRKWFDKKLNRITNDKERYIQSKISKVLAHKELAGLLKNDSPFLRLYKIDNKIEKVRKKAKPFRVSKRQMIGSLCELGVTKDSIILGDLCSIIKNMDTVIYQTPYIERGIRNLSNYIPKVNQRT